MLGGNLRKVCCSATSSVCSCQRHCNFSINFGTKITGSYYGNGTTGKLEGERRKFIIQPGSRIKPQERGFTKSAIQNGEASSVSSEEVSKFERMSSSWWDSTGGLMKELHSMNRLRVPFIRDGLLQNCETGRDIQTPKPLEGFRILDVGCGGGILCEPLGRLGATVKGVDPGTENISVAMTHLPEKLQRQVSYECVSIEEFVVKQEGERSYDAVIMSEVIEHVENPQNFIRTAVEILKPGGSFFLTTLNRTTESWIGAIVAWEYVLRRLPVGTHEWKKFLTPEEVERIMKSIGLKTALVHGMCYNPINNTWKWSSHRPINYAFHAIKD